MCSKFWVKRVDGLWSHWVTELGSCLPSLAPCCLRTEALACWLRAGQPTAHGKDQMAPVSAVTVFFWVLVFVSCSWFSEDLVSYLGGRCIKSILDWFLRAAAFSISVLVFWMTLCLWARDLGNLIMTSVHAPLSLSLSFFLPVPPVSSLSPVFSLPFLTKSLSSGSRLFHLHLPLSTSFPICLLIF